MKLTPKQCDILVRLRDGRKVYGAIEAVVSLMAAKLVHRDPAAGLQLTELGRAEVGPSKAPAPKAPE